ncbi:hypothetical protein ABZS66_37315 [Dactylosporangium sp. NPDC005572]|uniref:hypothetical protein n=1 Tax=Dactylosporangium sp. NPDC005572 TaxID=3156889 RepID=UPI0033A4E7CC
MKAKPAVVVVLPGTVEWVKQANVLLGYCLANHLRAVSVLSGDPFDAVPLVTDGLVDAVVVAYQDQAGMVDRAELAVTAAGGTFHCARPSGRSTRKQAVTNPIVKRLGERGMKPDEIAEIVGQPVKEVIEQLLTAGLRVHGISRARELGIG